MARRLIMVVAVAAVIAGAVVPLSSSFAESGCTSHACRARVTARVFARHHSGCRTSACLGRVQRVHWRRVTAKWQGWLAATRQCESTNNYGTATGNGFYGAYQFTWQTWNSALVGGSGNPALASPLEQDYRAIRLLVRSGPQNWPHCAGGPH